MNALRFRIVLDIVVVLPLSLLLHACSLIGLTTGAAIDGGRPDSVMVSSWAVDTLKAGEEVTLLMKDGSEVKGEFSGLQLDSLAAYQSRYAQYRATGRPLALIPAPGDSVAGVLSGRVRRSGAIAAYDYNGVYMTIWGERPTLVRYSGIDSLTWNGRRLSGSELRGAVMSDEIPLRTELMLRQAPGVNRSFPLTSIQAVTYRASKTGAITGLLIGAAVDAVIIIAAASSASQPKTSGSCPFVYSFDGNGYVLDSETFSGAICQSLQRTDWDNLEHLKEVGGVCSLRVENRLRETQYLDALRVLVAEHPVGSRVVADGPGVVHVMGTMRPPVEASTSSGGMVTSLVRSSDSLAWVSNPAGCDPGKPGSVRDFLVIRFDRPRDAAKARLVLTLRNTFWSTELEKELLRLQGSHLEAWYEEINDSPEFRDEFVEIVRREAMLGVQVWTGNGWRTARHIAFPGPFAERSFVIPLEIQPDDGPELRVRLESTVGLWVVNYVGVDFNEPSAVQLREAVIMNARGRDGDDVREVLADLDGRYRVLQTDDRLDISCAIPAATPGYERTFVLESSGYYTIDVTPGGAPQWSLLKSFSNEPGAFGRWSVKLFHRWLDRQLGQSRSEATALWEGN